MGEYFKVWIESKNHTQHAKAKSGDYREDFRRYILPKFEVVSLKDVSPRKLLDFRTYLTDERLI